MKAVSAYYVRMGMTADLERVYGTGDPSGVGGNKDVEQEGLFG